LGQRARRRWDLFFQNVHVHPNGSYEWDTYAKAGVLPADSEPEREAKLARHHEWTYRRDTNLSRAIGSGLLALVTYTLMSRTDAAPLDAMVMGAIAAYAAWLAGHR
jgi:hypothetical protein